MCRKGGAVNAQCPVNTESLFTFGVSERKGKRTCFGALLPPPSDGGSEGLRKGDFRPVKRGRREEGLWRQIKFGNDFATTGGLERRRRRGGEWYIRANGRSEKKERRRRKVLLGAEENEGGWHWGSPRIGWKSGGFFACVESFLTHGTTVKARPWHRLNFLRHNFSPEAEEEEEEEEGDGRDFSRWRRNFAARRRRARSSLPTPFRKSSLPSATLFLSAKERRHPLKANSWKDRDREEEVQDSEAICIHLFSISRVQKISRERGLQSKRVTWWLRNEKGPFRSPYLFSSSIRVGYLINSRKAITPPQRHGRSTTGFFIAFYLLLPSLPPGRIGGRLRSRRPGLCSGRRPLGGGGGVVLSGVGGGADAAGARWRRGGRGHNI